VAAPPYCWPVKPFGKAHPIRGYFNDPRVLGKSRAFHFGVDVSCPDGTPVHSVEPGKVHVEGPATLSVVSSISPRTFGYYHLVPAVQHHQMVRKHQLIGYVQATWGHVHFAESSLKKYRNPLRGGALEPWTDLTTPRITNIVFYRTKKQLQVPPEQVRGIVDVVVEAHDVPPLRVPPPWANMPVTPARLRWRVLCKGKVVRPWHTPVDFTKTLVPRELFATIYAPGTRQNHPNEPGLYRFFIARRWFTTELTDGEYRLQVEAKDISGNYARSAIAFRLVNAPL
jgi:Peptidase family M23